MLACLGGERICRGLRAALVAPLLPAILRLGPGGRASRPPTVRERRTLATTSDEFWRRPRSLPVHPTARTEGGNFDVFSGLDGFGAAGGDWTGYWGRQGPEITERCLASYGHWLLVVVSHEQWPARIISVFANREGSKAWST